MNLFKHKLYNSWPFWTGLILGLLIFLSTTFGFSLSYLPGDLGDTRFNIYILEHGYKFLIGETSDYWNAPFMVPEASVISYSDNLIGTVPIYTLFRTFGLSIFTAFQLWFITMIVLNYSSTYFFFNWLFKNRYAAVLGAFTFTFSIALYTQMVHAQTIPRFYIPLAIWMLFLFKEQLQAKFLMLAALFMVLQFYNGIYLGFLLVVPFSIILFGGMIQQRSLFIQRIREWRWISSILMIFLINGLLLYLLMEPYYLRSQLESPYRYEQIITSVPTIRSFFHSSEGGLLWTKVNLARSYEFHFNHQLFVGLIALASVLFLTASLFIKKIQKWSKNILASNRGLIIITIISTFLLFIRYKGWSFYYLLYQIPGFSSMRSLTRIINVELLFFGIAVGLLFLYITRQKSEKIMTLVFMLVLGTLAIDNLVIDTPFVAKKAMFEERHDKLMNKMKHVPKGSLVSFEPTEIELPGHIYQLDAMLASQALGLACVNGYSATAPYCFDKYWELPNKENRLIWFEVEKYTPDTVFVIK